MRYNKIEVITMEKTMTLNLRVNPTVKQQAEDVLKQLGIPMATAIDMYLLLSIKLSLNLLSYVITIMKID